MFVWLFFWSVNDEHSLHLQSDFKTEKINLTRKIFLSNRSMHLKVNLHFHTHKEKKCRS